MNVRRVPFKPALVKRKDNLIVFNLPCTSYCSVSTRPIPKFAAIIVIDVNSVRELIDGDIVLRRRCLPVRKLAEKVP